MRSVGFHNQLSICCPLRAHPDNATSRRPLLLGRRGVGRGGRHAGKPLLAFPPIAFVPLSPTLSARSAGGEREKPSVAVSKCARSLARRRRLLDQPDFGNLARAAIAAQPGLAEPAQRELALLCCCRRDRKLQRLEG